MIIRPVIIGIDASRLVDSMATGTERYSREVTAALLNLAPQHTYRLYARPDRMSVPAELAQQHTGVSVVPIQTRRFWTHIGLAREIAQHPPDALFIPAHVLPFSQVLQRTTRTVVTIHDVGYEYFPRAHPLFQRLYLRLSTAVTARYATSLVVDSMATLRDVQRFYGVGESRVRVAYPGLIALTDTNSAVEGSVLSQCDLRHGTPYVLYVGILQPRKNLRHLLSAWSVLLSTWPSEDAPVLVIAGAQGWGGEDLRAEAELMGIASRVRFTGYINDNEKAALMHHAQVFAFPSLYEGFGLPVLEAQSAGVPVVCSNTSALPEVAGDGALFVDPLDTEQLTDALRVALTDNPTRLRLIAAGCINVKRFTWERCAEVVLQMLETKG
jgi:glycosyltransferase involved in cell wall biosynthesis